MLCKILASQAKDGVRQSVTFVDGHSVRHAVTKVHHDQRLPEGDHSSVSSELPSTGLTNQQSDSDTEPANQSRAAHR